MKNRTTSNSAQTWVTAHCGEGTFLMHAKRKAAKPRETLAKQLMVMVYCFIWQPTSRSTI